MVGLTNVEGLMLNQFAYFGNRLVLINIIAYILSMYSRTNLVPTKPKAKQIKLIQVSLIASGPRQPLSNRPDNKIAKQSQAMLLNATLCSSFCSCKLS